MLVSKTFISEAENFPANVDMALAEVTTIEGAKEYLDKAVAIQKYVEQLKLGVEVAKPVAFGVLKIKARMGELMERGQPGRGKKNPAPPEGFSSNTVSSYRKIADHASELNDYYQSCEDIPGQRDFLHWCESGGVHVARNSGENEWYTPGYIIELAREAMGSIDLDPCSSKIAQQTVKAKRYFKIGDDALAQVWNGATNVWMNPPYEGKLISGFVQHLLWHIHESSHVKRAVVLTNNATETEWAQRLLSESCRVCFPGGRIKFLDKTGTPAKTPLQGQMICYLSKNRDRESEFMEQFSKIGKTLRA